jgi:hypothetical protein
MMQRRQKLERLQQQKKRHLQLGQLLGLVLALLEQELQPLGQELELLLGQLLSWSKRSTSRQLK